MGRFAWNRVRHWLIIGFQKHAWIPFFHGRYSQSVERLSVSTELFFSWAGKLRLWKCGTVILLRFRRVSPHDRRPVKNTEVHSHIQRYDSWALNRLDNRSIKQNEELKLHFTLSKKKFTEKTAFWILDGNCQFSNFNSTQREKP